jgi:hypothetical protein
MIGTVKRAAVVVALLSQALSAQDSDSDYDLNARWLPSVGYKTKLDQTIKVKSRGVIRLGDRLLNPVERKEEFSFTAIETITKIDHDNVTEVEWSFSKATRVSDGKSVAYGFQGKAVLVKIGETTREFSYSDGTAPDGEDLEAIKRAFYRPNNAKKDPAVEKLLAAPKSLKIKDSWTPPGAAFLRRMLDREMARDVDYDKSKVVFTLKSVRPGRDVPIATVEGKFDIVLRRMGPIELDNPLTINSVGTVEVSMDGRPDREITTKMELLGQSATSAPNGRKVIVDVDVSGQTSFTQETVK